MSKGGGPCTKNASANSVVVKQRWLFCILILILFVISANIGITALLLYYINVTNVSTLTIRIMGRDHRYLLEYFADHVNKSTADQLAMQIKKLAIGS